MAAKLIEQDRSVSLAINSCSLDALKEIVAATHDVPGVESYTIGPAVGISGLYAALRIIGRHDPTKRTIYDYHHAGEVNMDRARSTLRAIADAGTEAVVLSSVENVDEQKRWLEASEDEFLEVIMGIEASQPPDAPGNEVSNCVLSQEGAGREFIRKAASNGVDNFWLRATDTRRVRAYEEVLLEEGRTEGTLFLARIADPSGQLLAKAPRQVPAVAVIGTAVCDAHDARNAAFKLSQAFLYT